LIERMGLFVIIVLGEVIVGAVTGMADVHPLEAEGIVIGLLGVVVAIGLWWIYFDLVSYRVPVPRRTQLWLNLHFPLVVAIAGGGAAVLNTVEHAGRPLPDAVRWLLVGSLAAAMLSNALIAWTLEIRRTQPELYRTAEIALPVCALLCLGGRPHRLGRQGEPLRDGGAAPRPGGGGHGRVAQAPRTGHGRPGLS
jgi:low temperature requirement protein LtrA